MEPTDSQTRHGVPGRLPAPEEPAARRRESLAITQADLSGLMTLDAALSPVVEQAVDEILRTLPDAPAGFRAWLTDLLTGLTAERDDGQRLRECHRLGAALRAMALPPRWIPLAHGIYLRRLQTLLARRATDHWVTVCKLSLLDQSLLMDGYFVPQPSGAEAADDNTNTDKAHLDTMPEHTELLVSALEQTADPVMITSRDGTVRYVNEAFQTMSGYAASEVVGQSVDALRSGHHDRDFYERLNQALQRGKSFREVFVNRRKNGELYHEEKTLSPLRDHHGRITHYLSLGRDIGGADDMEQRLHLSHHDPLTGLVNRVVFEDTLGQALRRARRHQRVVAVLALDLDGFRLLNRNLGLEAGDELLRQTAHRLRRCLRDNDFIARLTGDAFTVLLEDIRGNTDVSRVVNKIHRSLSLPVTLGGQRHLPTVSIGISLFPLDADTAQPLLNQALDALGTARERGGNTYQYYSRDLDGDTLYRSHLHRLNDALEQNEFRLHYQQQVRADTLRPQRVEVLLRWHHPEQGLLPPRAFLPILEENGLITSVGLWVLRRACRQALAWRQAGYEVTTLAVNISAQQFRDPGLVAGVRTVLQETGLPPHCLELEFPENVLMSSMHLSLQILHALADLGVRLAMDDFGTAHASLPNLLRLPLNTLKIDHRLLRDVPHNVQDAVLVISAINLGHSLGLEVVAEGVETEEQLRFLQTHGCDLFQGYYLHPSLSSDDMECLLNRQSPPDGSQLH